MAAALLVFNCLANSVKTMGRCLHHRKITKAKKHYGGLQQLSRDKDGGSMTAQFVRPAIFAKRGDAILVGTKFEPSWLDGTNAFRV